MLGAKPFLFVATRDGLRGIGKLTVVHTPTEEYFPWNEDLEARGISIDSHDNDILTRLGDVFMRTEPLQPQSNTSGDCRA